MRKNCLIFTEKSLAATKSRINRATPANVNPQATEYQEQVAVIDWCNHHPIAKHIFAITNGARVAIGQAVKLKRAGVRKGVPDLFLPVPRREDYGLFIELKRKKGGVISTEQKEWIKTLRGNGYAAVVCAGADEAITVIKNYLQLPT